MVGKTAISGDCRCKLIEAATEAFITEGYRASVDSIAARAGVAKQTLYNNFASKTELFTEVGHLLADAITVDLVGDVSDLRETLIRFGLTLRQQVLSDSGIALFRTFVGDAPRVPELRALKARAHATLFGRLAPLIAQAMEKSELCRDEPEFATQMLLSMLMDADRHPRLAGQAALEGEVEKARVARIVDCFLRAFAPPSV